MESNKEILNATVSSADSIIIEAVLVSDEISFIITTINYALISEVISLIGIITNIMTIVVLVKQGFHRTVNISLMGLSIADLCSVFFKACVGVAFNPLVWGDTISFIPPEMSVLTVSWPHATFTRISGWITAFITLERCLCVAIPLTIKRVLTPGRNCIILACIYVGVIAGVMPNYYTTRYSWKYVKERNRTLLGIVYSDDMKNIESVSLGINNVFSPLSNFGIVIVCTAILVYNLNEKSKWRKSATRNTTASSNSLDVASPQSSSISSKETKVIKLVVAISTVFIVTSIPTTACFIWMIIDPEFNLVGRLRNIYDILASSTFIFESSNCSLNLFLYIYTSTDFRDTFQAVFKSSTRCRNSNGSSTQGHKINFDPKSRTSVGRVDKVSRTEELNAVGSNTVESVE